MVRVSRFVILTLTLLLCAPDTQAQHQQIEWLMRIPKYYRLKGGSSQFVMDDTRKAMLFDGGAYDTYVTYDEGATWETIFDMKMFYIDVSSTWRIDKRGNWYYDGRIYNKPHLNLVTEDAGKTIRYLVVDSSDIPGGARFEPGIKLIMPDAVLMDLAPYDLGERRGLYTSCDVGRTWQFLPTINPSTSIGSLTTVGSNVLNLTPSSGGPWLELHACDGTVDSTAISQLSQYLRMADNTLLTWSTYYSHFFNIQHPGVDTPEVLTHYPDAETGLPRVLDPTYVDHLNDTMAVIIGRNGVIATYSLRAGYRYLDIPPYRNPHQQLVDYGRYGERALFRSVSPGASSDSIVRYTLLNTRTGEHKTFARPGTGRTLRLLSWTQEIRENQRIVPYSDSSWLASFQAGELMRTTDAGMTWKMVDNINRDERWGLTYVGLDRLFPRGDGTMSTLTERSRLMVQDSATKEWTVAHLGPFVHRVKLPSNYTDPFSGTSITYGEDDGGRLRNRYGPSTVYFHTPDTLWTSGDALTRWTSSAKFIDTVLPRHTRFIKRVSQDLIVAAMDSVWFSWSNGKAWTYVSKDWPKLVLGEKFTDTTLSALGDIVVADNNDLIVGLRGIRLVDTLGAIVDSIPGGILRSIDSGNTWTRSTSGIPENLYVTSLLKLQTGTLLCLAVEITLNPNVLGEVGVRRKSFDQCFGTEYKLGYGYIYRSADHGRTWTQVHVFSSREFLTHVDPRLTFMPDGRAMAIHPEVGIAISPNDGNWFSVGDPLYVGNPNVSDVVFTNDGYAHFATDSGYLRIGIDRILGLPTEQRTIGSLSAYVNASGVLKIATTDFIPTTLRLLSIDGRTARQGTDINGITDLDVSSLACGTYVVVASSTTEVRTTLIQLP